MHGTSLASEHPAAVGCARGAFEECLNYTGERVVGGKPVRDHSIAAGILADAMERARDYGRAALENLDTFAESAIKTALSETLEQSLRRIS